MEFSKRIAVLASLATWGCVVLGAASAALTAAFVPDAVVHPVQVAAWSVFGAVLAAITTVLATRAQRAGVTLAASVKVGRAILVAEVVYVTGLSTASGGLLGCEAAHREVE